MTDALCLSTIIPTFRRANLLRRAIDSALASGPTDNTEVIVVPNGPDESWREVASDLQDDTRIRWYPISEANVSAARNHGLGRAVGRYVRFLDDDDYLLPAAAQQVGLLDRTAADVCVGWIQLVNAAGRVVGARTPLLVADFGESILRIGACTLSQAYVYRRVALGPVRWNVKASLAEDKQWLYDLLANREPSFCTLPSFVGVWYQHRGTRLSGGVPMRVQSRTWAHMLLSTMRTLDAQHRLVGSRREKAISHLWKLISDAYYLEPAYWSGVMNALSEFNCSGKHQLTCYGMRIPARIPARWWLRGSLPAMHLLRCIRIAAAGAGVYHPTIRP